MRRLSEHASLLELATALGSDLQGPERLATALANVLRELQVETWALFVRGKDGGLAPGPSRGLPPGAPATLGRAGPVEGVTALAPGDDAHDRHGLSLLVPIRRRGRTIAVLGVGPRAGGYGAQEQRYLGSVAACLALSVENGLIHDELRRAHRTLTLKAFELHNLFDASRDLTGASAEDAIQRLVATTVMGHFLVARCGIYLSGPLGLALTHGRGLRREAAGALVPVEEARAALAGLTRPSAVAELPDGLLRRGLLEARLALAVPMVATDARVEGVLAIGERASGLPFSEEDREVALTLARQAQAALENARLQRVREAKQRQDRELQIAREIQQSLLPSAPLSVPGFELAGDSRPCFEVGGDSYDWIPLERERLALVVADVAGKGTPASLLMATAHAFVHALAGTAPPAQVIERLNRFLFARTHASRFVTLFYAELDPVARRLLYVNAGHVPPFLLARGGTLRRLTKGGPALGLLPDASYAIGEVALDAGDLVAMVTDGVTEAMSPDELELGEDRVCEVLRRLAGDGASAALGGLVAVVDAWAGARGRSDDLTALILEAR